MKNVFLWGVTIWRAAMKWHLPDSPTAQSDEPARTPASNTKKVTTVAVSRGAGAVSPKLGSVPVPISDAENPAFDLGRFDRSTWIDGKPPVRVK